MIDKKQIRELSRVEKRVKRAQQVYAAARKKAISSKRFDKKLAQLDMKLAQRLDSAGHKDLAQEVASISEKKPGFWDKFSAGFSGMTPARRFKLIGGGLFSALILFGGISFLLIWYRGTDIPILRNFTEESTPVLAMSKQLETEYGVDVTENDLSISTPEGIQFRTLGIENKVSIEPEVDIDIELSADRSRITVAPSDDLEPGTEYRVTLRKGTMFSNGTSLQEDFTWTFRTEPIFSVVGMTPRDGSDSAPVDAAIEVEFNYKDLDAVDFANYFEVVPPITGRFESHEKKIVFLPDRQLVEGTEYRVTVRAGFANSRGDLLPQNYSSTFRVGYFDSSGVRIDQPMIYWSESLPIISVNKDIWMGVATDGISTNLDFSLYLATEEALVQSMSRYETELVKPSPELLTPISNFSKTPGEATFFNITFDDYGIYFLELNNGEYGRPLYKYIVFSPIGMVESSALDSDKVWVYNLNDRLPAGDVSISFYDFDSGVSPVDIGSTDANGYFGSDSGEIDLAIANLAGNYAVTTGVRDWSVWWGVGYRALPNSAWNEPYRAFIYTDRPLYRPGDEVRFKVILREENDFEFDLPGGKSITVATGGGSQYYWNGTRSLPVFEESYTVSEAYGTVTDSFELPSNLTAGYQTLSVMVDGNVVGSGSISVAEYTKPRQTLGITVDKNYALNGENVHVDIQSNDYSSQPAAGSVVNVRVSRLSPSGSNWIEGWDDLETMRGRHWGGDQSGVIDTQITLDATGHATFDFVPDISGISTNIMKYTVSVTSQENYVNSSSASVLVAPTNIQLFAKPEEYSVVDGGDNTIIFKMLGIWDLDPEAGVRIFVDNMVRTYTTWSESDTYYDPVTKTVRPVYSSSSYSDVINLDRQLTSDSNGEATLELTDLDYGVYTINAIYYNTNGYSKTFTSLFYVYEEPTGGMYSDWQRSSDRFRIYTDKESYSVGDTANVTIKTTLAGKGIVMFERGDVYDWKTVDFATGIVTVQQAISDSMAPSMNICVWGIDEYTSSDNPYTGVTSQYLTDVFVDQCLAVNVARDYGRLNVEITPDKSSYMPGEQVTLDINVTDEDGRGVVTELSVDVVDKALLDIVGRSSSLPADAVYGVHQAFYSTVRQVASLRTSAYKYMYFGRTGGAGGGGGATERSDFPDVAYWTGAVETDRTGNASVTFTLPDNLTTWTARVLAVSADTWVGEAETNFTVSKDVSIDALIPKFLRSGDNWGMDVEVRNYSWSDVYGTLRVSCVGCDQGEFSKDVYVAAGTILTETVQVVPGTGIDSISVSAELISNETSVDAVVWDIPVMGDGFIQGVTNNMLLTDGTDNGELNVTIPDTVNLDSVDLDLTFARSYINENALVPVDPTVSSSVDLSASIIHNSFIVKYYDRISPEESKDMYIKKIKSAVDLLYDNQEAGGGFGWFDYDAVNYELSAYVGVALGMAVDSGAIPAGPEIENLRMYLNEGLYSESFSIDEKILAVYSLAVLGDHGVLPYATWLKNNPDEFSDSPLDVAHLMLALQRLYNMGDAGELIPLLEATALRSGRAATWEDADTDFRVVSSVEYTTAVVYEALAYYTDGELEGLARNWLIDNPITVSGKSVEAVQIFYSLAVSNIENLEGADGNNNVRVKVNGREIRNFDIDGSSNSINKVSLTVPASNLQSGSNVIEVERDGSGDLYMIANLSYYSTVVDGDQEFTVSHSLRDFYTGEVVTSVTKGQVVMVHTEVIVDRAGYNLVAKSFVPGGFEPVQYALNANGDGYTEIAKWWKWGAGDFVNRYGSIAQDHVTFTEYSVVAGTTYTFEYPVVATFTGSFSGGGSQGFLLNFEDVSGTGSLGTVVVR